MSCLTLSNLPWFINLTFQVPMQYCSLQHQTSITSHIHNWVLFLLWLCLFILSGVISPLISSSLLGTYWPVEFTFQCPIFLPFHSLHGVIKARILKWFVIPFSSGPHFVDHLICFLRNLYAGQEATVRNGHGKTDWFQIRKGIHQGCILSPCLFNLYAQDIMRNAGLDEAQAGIKIACRNINNLICADDTTLMAESEEKPLDESERGEWKSWLKAQHSEN